MNDQQFINEAFNSDYIYDEGSGLLVGTKVKTVQIMETGQVMAVQSVTKKTINQKQFWKLYLTDFLQVLGILESKQLDVLIYILDHTSTSTNTFLGSYRKIAADTGISLDTVRKVMKKLQTSNFILKIQNGAYLISPKILMKGNQNKSAMLLEYYYDNGGGEQESESLKSEEVQEAKSKLKKYKNKNKPFGNTSNKGVMTDEAENSSHYEQLVLQSVTDNAGYN